MHRDCVSVQIVAVVTLRQYSNGTLEPALRRAVVRDSASGAAPPRHRASLACDRRALTEDPPSVRAAVQRYPESEKVRYQCEINAIQWTLSVSSNRTEEVGNNGQ